MRFQRLIFDMTVSGMQLYKFGLGEHLIKIKLIRWQNQSHSSSGILADTPLLAFMDNTEKEVSNESKFYSQAQNIFDIAKVFT